MAAIYQSRPGKSQPQKQARMFSIQGRDNSEVSKGRPKSRKAQQESGYNGTTGTIESKQSFMHAFHLGNDALYNRIQRSIIHVRKANLQLKISKTEQNRQNTRVLPFHHPVHEQNSHTTWAQSDWPQPRSGPVWPRPHPNANHQEDVPEGLLVWNHQPQPWHRSLHLYGPSTHAKHRGSQQLRASTNPAPSRHRTWTGYNPAVQ